MVRADRCDAPGSLHHLVNRGIARRTIFEERADYRYFQRLLARVLRLGLLEVHAFCLLPNHFHLLARSPVGELSEAMRLLQNPFARHFNRGRHRDGPLFRGRFLSRPVESETYWWTLLRYIDDNPVRAGLVARPELYPYGSACHYARPGPRPRWLVRGPVESALMGARDVPYDPSRYRSTLSNRPGQPEAEIVERRLLLPSSVAEDPIDDLTRMTGQEITEWQRRKARLADGTRAGLPVTTAATVLLLISGRADTGQRLPVKPRRVRVSGWPILAAGLLRRACGLSLREIGMRTGCSNSTAAGRIREHLHLLAEDAVYAEIAGEVLQAALRADLGPPLAAREATEF